MSEREGEEGMKEGWFVGDREEVVGDRGVDVREEGCEEGEQVLGGKERGSVDEGGWGKRLKGGCRGEVGEVGLES